MSFQTELSGRMPVLSKINLFLIKFIQVKKIAILILVIMGLHSMDAQENYKPSKENIEARKWFQNARFGLFVHWGVYSILGDGEWVMNNQNIAIDEYEKLPTFFYPIEFDADAWVRMAKDAGMKYITITSRHHDGFSMFDSKVTDYTIVKKTPYKKDVLKLLAEACKKEGIKLMFYYSLLDWHDDNYFPRGRTGTKIPGRSTEGDWDKYIAFMKAQLTELLTNYGEIAGIWFDGHWDQKEWDGKRFGALKVDWHYDEIYKLIHDLQPHCLIGNNHHLAPISGEDFQMFERDLPGQNTTGFGTDVSDLGQLPFETCKTINGSWGFNLKDREHKSSRELIQYLIKASGHNSNLLLNVGPMPNGKIQEKHVASLAAMGKWLREYGESIYGAKPGPIQQGDSIVSTQKGKEIYIHFLNGQNGSTTLNGFKGKIKKVTFFGSDKGIKYSLKKETVRFEIPENESDEIDTIVVITLR